MKRSGERASLFPKDISSKINILNFFLFYLKLKKKPISGKNSGKATVEVNVLLKLKTALLFYTYLFLFYLENLGSNEICCWTFYGHGKKIAEVCCTAIVYATDRKNTKVTLSVIISEIHKFNFFTYLAIA